MTGEAHLPTLTHRPLRVLIVEDEHRLRDLLVDVVPDMGFPAACVRSAEEALRLMQADPHEILILDLQLPAMMGMELFERIHQDWPATQVIILTAYGDLATAQMAIRLDVVEFLSKPCHLCDLERALDRARQRLAGLVPQEPIAPETDPAPPPAGSTLAETEYQQIITALRRNAGNRTAAAAELGIARRTLHYRLAEYRARGLPVE